ncbi:MAG: hypothetical protein J7J93_03300 [Candidatus Aenigmarchaeota archaeon]|nr:hypothetical protein [Candidatus Aenigmarchaeota archaeon]
MGIFYELEKQAIKILEQIPDKRKYDGFFDYEIKDIPQLILTALLNKGIIEIKEIGDRITVYKINKTEYEKYLNTIESTENKGDISVKG